MSWVRARVRTVLAVWMLFQVAGILMPIALAASTAAVEELCTCPGGDHATCPMHHGKPEPTPDAARAACAMRSACAQPDAALLSMAGGAGVLPSFSTWTVPVTVRLVTAVAAPTLPTRTELPDAPPPRL